MTKIPQVDDNELKEWYLNDRFHKDLILIDIREKDEFEQEFIESSYNVPTMQVPQTDFSEVSSKTAVFLCRSGNRTKVYEDFLLAAGFQQNYCLDGGILQWKRCDLPTVIKK